MFDEELFETNVAAYGRASTDKQDQSIEAQQVAMSGYAASKHLPEPKLVLESDVSGSIPFAERPLAGPLLRDCLAGKYRHLIVPKIDRLGRDAIDVQNVIAQLGKADVTVHILDLGGSSFDTKSPISGMIIAVLAWAAQMMRETIVSNINNQLRHKRSKGELTGTVPYGWNAIETGETRANKGGKIVHVKRIEPNPAEQKWILHMATLRAAGWSYKRIADDLNRQGVPTKNGAGAIMKLRTGKRSADTKFTSGKWQCGQVAKILNSKTVLSWLASQNEQQAAA